MSKFSFVVAALLCQSAAVGVCADRVELSTDTSTAMPAPAWVKMIDLGAANPALKGYFAPAGIKVEVVATEPQTIDPVGMMFDDAGRMLVLEWRAGQGSSFPALDEFDLTYRDGSKRKRYRNRKSVTDEVKLLEDRDGDGRYESARVLIDKLVTPSSMLLHDGYLYFSGSARVVRHKVLGDDKFGPPEEILRGFAGFNQHQVSGLTIGPDGWLYLTSGDDDNFVEGSDGSRATTSRCGGVFRCRPDGSRVGVYSLGFRNPYRDVVFDDFGNMFHADNDNEDGSKFQGCRLMHLLEGADYGWRLQPGVHCCRPDHALGAVFGERAGMMPSMAKTGRGAPAGLTIYNSDKFPEFMRGLLLYPDVVQKSVRAYRVARADSTFAVAEQFELLRSDDPLFRPVQTVVGPDGALYIVDWRTNSTGPGWFWGDAIHGRIWRLTWGGTNDLPAIARGGLETWAKLASADENTLFAVAASADRPAAVRALAALKRQGDKHRARLIAVARDSAQPLAARTSALQTALEWPSAETLAALVELSQDPQVEVARAAVELLGQHARPATAEDAAFKALQHALTAGPIASRRAAALGLGRLAKSAAAASQSDIVAQAVNQLIAQLIAAGAQPASDDVFYRDGLVRGLEEIGPAAAPALTAIAISTKAEEQASRQAVLTAICAMRAPQAAALVDAVLSQGAALAPAEQISLLLTYRNIQTDRAVDVSGIGKWLSGHPNLPNEVQLAALESMALAGKADEASVLPIVLGILKSDNAQTRLATIRVVGSYGLLGAARPLVELLKDPQRSREEQQAIVGTLGQLRPLEGFGVIESGAKGVAGVTDDLVALANEPKFGPVRGDVLALLATLDFNKARPLATRLLGDADLSVAAAALNALGAKPAEAARIGRQFVDREIDARLLPQVAAVLQKHVAADKSGKLANLLAEVFKGGLLVSTDPAELSRVEQLVQTTGDAGRGRAVYLDSARSQCINCHGLEGVGGNVGPDLTKIWQTITTGKVLEAILSPSKEIKENYQTFAVTTTDGQVYSGLRISADDKQVVIRNAEGKDITVPRGEIDEMADLKRSLMPEGVVAQLTYQEFIDLVAFLKNQAAQAELRTTLTSAWAVGGAAAEIEKASAAIVDPLQAIAGTKGQPVTWQRIACDPYGKIPVGKFNAAGRTPLYVLGYVYTPSDQNVEFTLAASPDCQLLIGGQPCNLATAGDQRRAAVQIKAGWTTVLVKLPQTSPALTLQLNVQGAGARLSAQPK